MNIEYEATFEKIDKVDLKERLILSGARLIKPEFILKRNVFYLPNGKEIDGGFLRVRDEGDKITMSLKIIGEKGIEDQKEICLKVDDFFKATDFLNSIGCEQKAYQETKREIWELDGVEIDIDEWPFLEPFVEIEADSEAEVIRVSEKLGFDYDEALFCSAGMLYSKKYDLPLDKINNEIKLITFEMDNPFLKIKER